MLTAELVMQSLFIGIVLAVLTVGYNKLFLGRFVKALIKAEDNHPAFAKSFNELNIKKNFLFKLALRRGGTLNKIVSKLDDSRDMQAAAVNENDIKYYIPEDKIYRAGRLYGGKDVDMLMLASLIIILFLFFGIMLLYVPFLFDMIRNTFSRFF